MACIPQYAGEIFWKTCDSYCDANKTSWFLVINSCPIICLSLRSVEELNGADCAVFAHLHLVGLRMVIMLSFVLVSVLEQQLGKPVILGTERLEPIMFVGIAGLNSSPII
jgi:hypothetical protein